MFQFSGPLVEDDQETIFSLSHLYKSADFKGRILFSTAIVAKKWQQSLTEGLHPDRIMATEPPADLRRRTPGTGEAPAMQAGGGGGRPPEREKKNRYERESTEMNL